MSPGNLFHYFADKDSLILSLVEADQAETTARFAAAAEAKDAWRALTELLDHQLALCADPAFVRLTLDVIGEAARHPILMGCVQRSEAARRLSLQAMLHRHAGSGQLRLTRGPEAAADWFLLLMDGVLGRAMVEPDFSWTRYRADLLAALHLHIQLRPAKRRKPRR